MFVDQYLIAVSRLVSPMPTFVYNFNFISNSNITTNNNRGKPEEFELEQLFDIEKNRKVESFRISQFLFKLNFL